MKSNLMVCLFLCLLSLGSFAQETNGLVELEGVLGNQNVDRIELPAGFTRENSLLLAAYVEADLPASLCSGSVCKFRQNLLTNLRADDLAMPNAFAGTSWGVRMATLALDEDQVIIYHSALETVRPTRGAPTVSSQMVPVYVNHPYKIILKRYK